MYKLLILFSLLTNLAFSQTLDFAKMLTRGNGSNIADVARDADGNYYVIGQFWNAAGVDLDPSAGSASPPDPFGFGDDDNWRDSYIAKYNSNGEYQWSHAAYTRNSGYNSGDDLLFFTDVEVDSDGNIYVLGHIQGIADFDSGGQVSGSVYANGAVYRAFIRGYQANGDDLLDGSLNDFLIETGGSSISSGATGEALFIDNADNLYITGRHQEDVFGLSGYFSQHMAYYAKYNSAGVLQSAKTIAELASEATNSTTSGHDIYVDESGNIYVSGRFSGIADFDPSAGTTTMTGESGGDAFFAKYNSSGAFQWTEKLSDNSGLEIGFEIEPFGSNLLVRRTDQVLTTAISVYNTSGALSQTIPIDYTVNDMFISDDNDIYLAGDNAGITLTKLDDTFSEEYSIVLGTDRTKNYGHRVFKSGENIDFFGLKDSDVDFDPSAGTNSPSANEGAWMARYTEAAADESAPEVLSTNPLDGASGVSVTQAFTIEFNEEIVPPQASGSQFIRIISTNGGTLINIAWNTASVSSGYITLDGSTLTLKRGPLSYESDYYVFIPDDLLEDEAGNAITNLDNGNWFNFTTEAAPDTQAPSLLSKTPTDNATNVSINSSFTLEFDEPVQAGPANINPSLILKYGNSNTVEFISLTGDQAVFDGNTLTVTPTDPFLYFQTYYIEIPNGVIEDMDNNDYAGFTGSTTWNFQTEPSPFESQELSPAPNATDVSPTTDLSITFNKNADIGAGNITVYNASNDQPVETLQNYNGSYMAIDGATITFDFVDDLPPNTAFYVQVSDSYLRTSGVPTQHWEGIQDETTWTFTTGAAPDTEAPTVTSTVPADDATDVPVDFGTFVINCSEPVQISENPGVAGEDYFLEIKFTSIVIKRFDVTDPNDVEINGSQILLKNIPELDLDKYYQVRYYNYVSKPFEDLAGNKLGNYNNSTAFWFLTEEGDQIAPYATSTSPADEGTYAPLNASGGIVFNEDVQEATGTIELFLANGTLVESIPVGEGDPRLTQPGTFRIAWDFDTDLIPSTDYYILVSAGAYEDLAGNAFAGIDFGDLDFTANARPLITSTSPADDATDVSLSSSISIQFDNPVYTNEDVQLAIKEYASDNTFETFDISELSYPSGSINIEPTSDFADGTQYYVVLEGNGSIKSSTNAESFVGLDNKGDWSFTSETPDNTAPQLLSVTPADNSSFDPEARVLTMTFDEPIRFGSNILAYFKIYREDGSDYNNALFSEDDDRVSISGNVATVTFSGPEWPAGSYYVTLSNEAIEDFSENQFEGFSDPTFWNFTVNDLSKTDQTITFPEIDDINFGESVNLSATASSSLTVDFTITEGENLVSRDGDELTAIGVGTVTVQATQEGDESFNPAEPQTRTFTIAKAAQTITVQAIDDKLVSDPSFDVVASVDSELTLDYSVSGPATNSGATITLTGTTGTVTVTVSQEGNENYLEASESVTFDVTEIVLATEVENAISIYPNPVKDVLSISLSEQAQVRLLNLSGKVILQGTMTNGTLDVSLLESGLYFLEIDSPGQTQRMKILKTN